MNQHTSKYILIAVAAGLVGALLGTGGVAYFAQKQQQISPVQQQITQKPTETSKPAITTLQPQQDTQKPAEAPKQKSSGITWLPMPEKIAGDLGLIDVKKQTGLQPYQEYYHQGVEYYKTGSKAGNDIVIARIPRECQMDGCENIAFFEQHTGGYALIVKESDQELLNKGVGNIEPLLTKRVTLIDREKTYQDLRVPEKFEYMGATLESFSFDLNLPEPNFYEKNMTKIADVAFGTLYSLVQPFSSLPGAALQTYFVRKPNGMAIEYNYAPKIKGDDLVLKATWNDGSKNDQAYSQISVGGCGLGGGTPILQNNSLSGLVQTGTTPLGPVYEFKDPNMPLLKSIYDVVKTDPDALPYEAWLKKHPVIAFKDVLGSVILYNNTTYGPQAECGKPVIYLYPETPTDVNVVVGANIRVSDPPYNVAPPKRGFSFLTSPSGSSVVAPFGRGSFLTSPSGSSNGWHVLANPDGSLITADGSQYGSLFWEGLGHGVYPQIKSGFVVAQEDVEQTLLSHLVQLGLNEKESAEFLEFWLPKMPSTPYVRLTWFGTREMNALAPLTITPKPDTMIRIFLDFEGLEQTAAIEPQSLKSIPRKGFTVVEWGGILRR